MSAGPGGSGPPARIAVVGGGRASDQELRLAYELGAALAAEGAVVFCGGLGGVMEAAARGAGEADGLTVGLLPGADPHAANAWIRVPIPTGMGEARNVLVVRAAEAVIAVGGAWGTLSEIALAQKVGVPVAVLAPSRLTEPLGLEVLPDAAGASRWALEAARRRRAPTSPDGGVAG